MPICCYIQHELITVKGSPYLTAERRIPELIPVLGSQPAGDVSHKPGSRLPLLSARPTVTPATLKRVLPVLLLGEQRHMGVNSLSKIGTRQRRGCDLNPGRSALESSTLTTRRPSHPGLQLPVLRWTSSVECDPAVNSLDHWHSEHTE